MQTPDSQSPHASTNEAGRLPANAPDSAPLAAGREPQQEAPANGCELIAAERRRQMEVEGWSLEHDEQHDPGELAIAGMCYAAFAGNLIHPYTQGDGDWMTTPPEWWLWEAGWWKPSADPIRNLVKAGALIAAEIDRLHRAAQAACDEPPSGPQNLEPPAAIEGGPPIPDPR